MIIFWPIELSGNLKFADELSRIAEAFAADSGEVKETEVAMGELALELVGPLTPWVSGSLASSHAIFTSDEYTILMINPAAVNPYSPENPPEYGPEIHAMGGISRSGHDRAFYDVLVEEHGDEITELGETVFIATIEVSY